MAADDGCVLRVLADHGRDLHRLLTRLTLRADVADDLLQDLFLRLRKAEGFRRAREPAAYATRAAVRLAWDWRRRRRDVAPLEHEPADVCRDPALSLERREELERVLAALDALSGPVRLCVVLRYLEQLDPEDVARRVGRSAHQVRALCARGLARLRARLAVDREVSP